MGSIRKMLASRNAPTPIPLVLFIPVNGKVDYAMAEVKWFGLIKPLT